MRPIKFRAWEKTSKSMIYDVQNVNRKRIIGESACESFQEVLDSWEYEVMQYTGLKDKNGKEIYEKDILKFDNRRYVVTFDNGGFGIWKDVRVDLYSNQMRKFREPLWNLVIDECEIIGNIYENPELLEGEE